METFFGLLLFRVGLESDLKGLAERQYQIQACEDFLEKWEKKQRQVAGFFRKDRSNKLIRDITLVIFRARMKVAGKLSSAKNECKLCDNTCWICDGCDGRGHSRSMTVCDCQNPNAAAAPSMRKCPNCSHKLIPGPMYGLGL